MGSGVSLSRKKADSKDDEPWAEPLPMDRSILNDFQQLDQNGRVLAEYVVIESDQADGMSFDLCSKTLTLDTAPLSVSDLPKWSIGWNDETGASAEVHMVPRRMYQDPFRRGENIIVLVDCYKDAKEGSGDEHGAPTHFNTRVACEAAMSKAVDLGDDPWFGIEQEYYLVNPQTGRPLGWPKDCDPGKHDEAYFCSIGITKSVARDVVEVHARACLYAGIKFGGINSEVAPAQWEYQVGPCSGIQAADDLWMSRYILQRVCEMYSVGVSFDPKPVPGWAGIGAHTNYSTKATRTKPGGLAAMKQHAEKLRLRHAEHMKVYGQGNERRMTGKDDTASMSTFKYGIGDRSASIRIGRKIAERDCGFYEDRRPAANMDPYQVTRMLVETTILDGGRRNDAKDDTIIAPVTVPTTPGEINTDQSIELIKGC